VRSQVNAQDAFKNQQYPFQVGLVYMTLLMHQVDWEKLENDITGEVARTNKKQLRPHQTEALTKYK
jgi:predicted helicase